MENNYFYDDVGVGQDLIRFGVTNETVAEFNLNHSYAQNNVDQSSDPGLHPTNYSIVSGSNTALRSGGLDNGSENEEHIALHPGRVWTPFANMNANISTVTRGATVSIGPFQYAGKPAMLGD